MYNKGNLMKRFPVLIFVVIIVIVINGCFFTVDYRSNVALREEIVAQKQELIWDKVEEALRSEYSALSSEAKYLSKKIEVAILREYASDMDKLKNDFDNQRFDKTLYDLFKDELQKDASSLNQSTVTEAFNYILGFRDNILAVFSDANTDGLTTNMTWQEYFNSSANIALNEKLIYNILNKNLADNILLYQLGNLPDSNKQVLEHDMSSLKQIYNEYGLEGFKSFEFVNVSYITEYGDIFGTNDYLYMQSVSNHKMIIVKTSNVYDSIISELKPDIKNIETNHQIVLNQISDNIARKSLEFITVTLCLIMLILFGSMLYNKNLSNK